VTKLPKRACIFCGGTNLSREHLFADWLTDGGPIVKTKTDTRTFGKIYWKPDPRREVRRYPGHSGSMTVKKVCERCNNEWMSDIDNVAKAVALPLISTQWNSRIMLTPEDQRILATWLTKIAIVGDSLNSGQGESFITQEARAWFMAHRAPPPNWEVYIGLYLGERWRQLAINQHGGNLAIPAEPHSITGYIQTTCLGIGNLFSFVYAVESPDLEVTLGYANRFLRRIWPATGEMLWPLATVVSDSDAGELAMFLKTTKLVIER